MKNEMTIKQNTAFANPHLEKLTCELRDAFAVAGRTAEKARIKLATTLAIIEDEKLYKDDGFDSAKDYAMQIVGISESNAYAYIQVGHAINSASVVLTDAKGNEFTFSQLRAICGIKDTKARLEATANGNITADMTKDDIEATAKSINPEKKQRKAPAEKRYVWSIVGEDDQTADMSKTELIAKLSENGGQFLGELSNDGDKYIVAIAPNGYPVIYMQGEQVKAVVDAK